MHIPSLSLSLSLSLPSATPRRAKLFSVRRSRTPFERLLLLLLTGVRGRGKTAVILLRAARFSCAPAPRVLPSCAGRATPADDTRREGWGEMHFNFFYFKGTKRKVRNVARQMLRDFARFERWEGEHGDEFLSV